MEACFAFFCYGEIISYAGIKVYNLFQTTLSMALRQPSVVPFTNID